MVTLFVLALVAFAIVLVVCFLKRHSQRAFALLLFAAIVCAGAAFILGVIAWVIPSGHSQPSANQMPVVSTSMPSSSAASASPTAMKTVTASATPTPGPTVTVTKSAMQHPSGTTSATKSTSSTPTPTPSNRSTSSTLRPTHSKSQPAPKPTKTHSPKPKPVHHTAPAITYVQPLSSVPVGGSSQGYCITVNMHGSKGIMKLRSSSKGGFSQSAYSVSGNITKCPTYYAPKTEPKSGYDTITITVDWGRHRPVVLQQYISITNPKRP